MQVKKTVAMITSGYFPVPAVLGGAVEALDENLIQQNEIEKKVKFVVFSCFEDKAAEKAKQYLNTEFVFIKIPGIVKGIDRMIYYFAKNILHIEKSMSFRYIMQRLYYIRKVAKYLYTNSYDKIVIENHSTLFMTLKHYKNYEKYSGKYYYHLHNVVTNAYGCESIIANCKRVLGVSNYINGTLKNFIGDDDKNEYCVLQNKIDRQKFLITLSDSRRRKIREQFKIKKDDTVILFSGRFNPEKGIRELLDAFKLIHNEKTKLLIAGSYYFGSGMISPFEKEMYQLAESMSDRVVFTGFIPYSSMPEIYAIADIVVIPSIWDDPAPLTVIETLTSGKALITTNSGGIPEYADENSSIIVKRDKELIPNMARAIENLINDRSERERMENAVKEKTSSWTVKKFFEDFCNFIEI